MTETEKKIIEEAVFAIAFHMKGCAACIWSVLQDAKAEPPCAEYRRLKDEAKAKAGR